MNYQAKQSPPNVLQWEVSERPARRQFVAIAVFIAFLNILFQFLLVALPWVALQPMLRALIETFAVALFAVPPAYYFYIRPLLASLEDRQSSEKAVRKSEMHYRIVSELTTTFVFDLLVAEDGKVSLDFVSDNFYTFAERPAEEVRTFESLLSHIHPDDTGNLMEHLHRLVIKPQTAEIECRAYIKDSREPRWLSLCGKSEWDAEKERVTVIYGAVKDITDRKRAEEEKARVQNLLEVSQRIAHIGSWEYEMPTGRITLSEEMYRIAGIPIGSGITLDFAQAFLPPGDFLRSRKSIEASMEMGVPYNVDFEIQRPDGQKRIVHNEAEVVFDEQGIPARVFGTSQDITEHKLDQESLRAAEQITAGILNAIPAGVFWKDMNLSFLGCNLQFAKDAGFDDPSALVGKDDYQIGCPRELADRYREIDRRVIETGSAVMNVEDSLKRNGEDVTDLATIVPLRDSTGGISGVLGTYIEITERKRIEKALEENEKRLQQSEAKYRKLIETAPEAIYVVENEKVVFCNKHALEMLGYSREEMVGISMERINHPEDWEQARERYLSRTAGKSLAKSVGRHVTKDGRVIWIECVGEQIGWEGRDAVLYFSSDITERKRAESERLVVDQYLQQAQKLESLGVLAGGIAHDFNNILMGIFGFTDLARSEAKDPNVAEYLSQAMASMQQAKGLTQQLLTFSKGGAPVRKVVEVVPLIRETCQFALHGSKLKNSYDLQEDLWNCNIDRNQIGQVLQNIVINAIQSMPMGGTIKVSARNVVLKLQEHPTLKEGAYVVIRVRDQGIGMSKEMLSMIFDPFFTTKTEGHGLGLAISHSIIGRHGGAINVESELGKGSTLTVYLPACKELEAHAGEKVEIRHAGEGVILVMDDDEAIRILLSKMLESLGYSTICKENGKDTIECYKSEAEKGTAITAVVLDLTVPGGVGGKEVAEEIRKLNGGIPIFVSSGYAEDPVMSNPHDYGFTASLSKPFTKIELIEMLDRHLNRK